MCGPARLRAPPPLGPSRSRRQLARAFVFFLAPSPPHVIAVLWQRASAPINPAPGGRGEQKQGGACRAHPHPEGTCHARHSCRARVPAEPPAPACSPCLGRAAEITRVCVVAGGGRPPDTRAMAAAAAATTSSSSSASGGTLQQRRRQQLELEPEPGGRKPPPQLQRMDPRRRQAALSFLSNISLDGRPPPLQDGEREAAWPRAPPAPGAARLASPPAAPPLQVAAAAAGQDEEGGGGNGEEEEEDDAFASVQVPPAAFLGSAPPGAPGTRGRLNSFTQGILPTAFARPVPPPYCCLEQGAPGAGAFDLQRSR